VSICHFRLNRSILSRKITKRNLLQTSLSVQDQNHLKTESFIATEDIKTNANELLKFVFSNVRSIQTENKNLVVKEIRNKGSDLIQKLKIPSPRDEAWRFSFSVFIFVYIIIIIIIIINHDYFKIFVTIN